MPDVEKRVRYFNGQFLHQEDFRDEQAYHLDRERRHHRLFHTVGIAEGLNVTAAQGATTVQVSPGTALDDQGQLLVLAANESLPLGSSFNNKQVFVVISYEDAETDKATIGDDQPTRIREKPKVEIVDATNAPSAGGHVRLARLSINNSGQVTGAPDLSVRNSVGVKVGDVLAVGQLQISRTDVDPSLWAKLTASAAGMVDIQGDVAVTKSISSDTARVNKDATVGGNLTVTGRVNGRDVAADGTNLDGHRNNTNNPHSTTAAQVGAITGVGGVTNAGGSIAVVAGGAIVVTPDNSAGVKRITISESHSTRTDNPHSTTAAQVGALASVAGVTNAGGNIALLTGGTIAITPDNTNKRITISETHSTATGNPHGTLASQLADYDLGKRSVVGYSFNANDADGATRAVNLNFPARLVWATGVMYGILAGNYQGGSMNGVARIDSAGGLTQICNGPYIQRLTGIPYLLVSASANGVIGFGQFYDFTVTPNAHVNVTISIGSVTATGFTLTLNRSTQGGYNPLPTFYITLYLTCIGQ